MSGGLETDGFGEFFLAVVEGPEALGFEFEGGGYVQSVQRPRAEFCYMRAGEVSSDSKREFRLPYFAPDP